MSMDKDERKTLQELIVDRIDLSKHLSEEEIRELIDEQIQKESKRQYMDIGIREQLRKDIFHSIRQLGILQKLIEDPEITEIMVNGTSGIFVEKKGKLQKLDICFDSKEKLKHIIRQITSECNRVVNEASPIVDARLDNGARVNVVLEPVALNGPILTIRRFPPKPITMEELIFFGSVTEECKEWLKEQVESGSNILVSGGTGSGKTTFLNVLSQFIPERERVITIEDSAELQLNGISNLVSMETRNVNVEGCKEITIRDLIKTSLRMRPDSRMMKKGKSQHNKKCFAVPYGLPDNAAGDLVLFLHGELIEVGQKAHDLLPLLLGAFQHCIIPSFFQRRLRLCPAEFRELRIQRLDLRDDILCRSAFF